MSKRAKGEENSTLRQVLANNYNTLIDHKEYGKLAKKRFPHVTYGQDKNSITFKKSFPSSYKVYFFKLVKNIIKKKNGKRTINRFPTSLTITGGTRQATLSDPIIV
jgi:cell division protein FtsI/penicillin-binding protein 2